MQPQADVFQRRLAQVIDGAVLRNQGAAGVTLAARIFLETLDLRQFLTADAKAFAQELDRQTEALRLRLPANAQNWGASRKALNLFLLEACYNRILCAEYMLERIESFLEIPMDDQLGKYLRRKAVDLGVKTVPPWTTIKGLTPDKNRQYQEFAAHLAQQMGWYRVHLDIDTWHRQ